MTRTNFIALADKMRQSKPVYNQVPTDSEYTKGYENGRESQHNFLIEQLADFCERQNPQFKRDRWISYIQGTHTAHGRKL